MSPLKVETYSLLEKNWCGVNKKVGTNVLRDGFQNFPDVAFAKVNGNENLVTVNIKAAEVITGNADFRILPLGSFVRYELEAGKFRLKTLDSVIDLTALDMYGVPIRRKRQFGVMGLFTKQ